MAGMRIPNPSTIVEKPSAYAFLLVHLSQGSVNPCPCNRLNPRESGRCHLVNRRLLITLRAEEWTRKPITSLLRLTREPTVGDGR